MFRMGLSGISDRSMVEGSKDCRNWCHWLFLLSVYCRLLAALKINFLTCFFFFCTRSLQYLSYINVFFLVYSSFPSLLLFPPVVIPLLLIILLPSLLLLFLLIITSSSSPPPPLHCILLICLLLPLLPSRSFMNLFSFMMKSTRSQSRCVHDIYIHLHSLIFSYFEPSDILASPPHKSCSLHQWAQYTLTNYYENITRPTS